MEVVIKGSSIRDFVLEAPPSKSFTHRAYAIASLADGISTIKNPLRAGDTNSTLDACISFGAGVHEESSGIVISGTGGILKTPEKEVDVGNSGTTIRLFTSIAALDGLVRLTGDESIHRRPMQPLLEALGQLGVKGYSVNGDGKPPLEVHGGGIRGGIARIRGDISSQFISSLLIASPYAAEAVTIETTTTLKSRPYVDVTLSIMEKFGVEVENKDYKEFNIPTRRFKGRDYSVEGDYSSASYLLALAALCGVKGRVENLPKDTFQGDKVILGILAEMGAKVVEGKNGVTLEAGELEGVEVDLGDTPDLLPTVAALACAARGTTLIKNIGHARLKESDRVSASAKEFSRFGVKIKEGEDFLVIDGVKQLKGAKVNSYGDHRMVMALSILGVCAEGKTVIDQAESVDISFPGFFDTLKRAGVMVK